MNKNKKTFGALDTKEKKEIRKMEDMLKEKYDANKNASDSPKAIKIVPA